MGVCRLDGGGAGKWGDVCSVNGRDVKNEGPVAGKNVKADSGGATQLAQGFGFLHMR